MSPVRLTPVRDNAYTACTKTVFTTVEVLICKEIVETKKITKRPTIMRSHDTV